MCQQHRCFRELLYNWYQATENNENVRKVFLDYKKAFDRVNNHILLSKLKQLGAHPAITRWIASFLTNRTQYVKIWQHKSTTKQLKGILPQGTIFGMEGFVVMIYDLKLRLPCINKSTTQPLTKL